MMLLLQLLLLLLVLPMMMLLLPRPPLRACIAMPRPAHSCEPPSSSSS